MISKNPTKRNHVIPCFWSALWNQTYFEYFITGSEKKEGKKNAPREQKVFSLEFKAPKILLKKVDDLFYIQSLGISIVSEAELHKLQNIYSSEFQTIVTGDHFNKNNTAKTHLIDIENVFSLTEEYYGYKEMLDVVKTNNIPSIKEKTQVACFIAINLMRGLRFFSRLQEKYNTSENPQLESFKHFRGLLSDTDAMYNFVAPMVHSRWTLYSLDEYLFPLSDSPIIHYQKYIWVVISPKHMIEIDTSVKNWDGVRYKNRISSEKYIQLKTLIVKDTYSTIIFPNESFLTKLSKTYTWKKRKNALAGLDFSYF